MISVQKLLVIHCIVISTITGLVSDLVGKSNYCNRVKLIQYGW